MKINYKHFLAMLFVFFIQIAVAQEIKVTGVVTDKKGLPIPGANIIVQGAKEGTQTNFDGEFTINVQTGQQLVISYLGMKSIVVPAKTSMKITLEDAPNELEAVLVVGYGTQTKRKSTDNIARVTAKDIQQIPVANVQNALVGKLAGVQITQTNGKVDGGINIRVRGAASISAGTEPLYVLDGIPLVTSDESTNGAATNPLLTLSPNEIESIDVLKDASSAAIYGARGANGVIIITTKKGKDGKGTFSINMSQGISEATHKKKWLNADQYIKLFTEASINGTGDASEAESTFDFLAQGTDWRNRAVNTDWQDLAFQTGLTTDVDFSVSGGDAKTKYFFSGAYNNTTGIIDKNELERVTARSNVSHKVSDNFNIGMNLSFSRSVIDRVQDDNSFTTPLQAVAQSPLSPARLEDGTANPNTLYANYLLAADNSFWKTIMRRVTGKVFAEYQIIPSLKINSDFAYDLLSQTEDYWQGKNAPFMATDGEAYATSVNNETYIWSNYLTYDKTFAEKHNVNVVAGMEFNKYNRRYQSVTSIYFPDDSFQTVDGGAEVNAGAGNETNYTFVSQFGRLNYSYNNKYLFKASIRRDGSSRFGKNERFGVFPAFSAGWIVSEESFLKDNKVLSFLKLKGSWGKLGNAEIGNFASRQLYAANPYNLKSGLTFNQAGNDNLTWEKSTQVDYGIEFGLFSRISIEADYYNKTTDGLLFEVPLAISSGAATINQNIGKVRSSGLEFTVNTKNIENDNFKWNTSFNITTNKSEVLSMPNGKDIVTSYTINRVGENISSFYLVEYAGVDPANGDALYVKNTANADGTLDKSTTNDYSEAKRTIAGNPFPELMAGLTNTINYKGIDFSFTFQGEWGASIYNAAGQYQSTAADYFDNQTTDQLNRWQNPGDITNVPQARLYGSNGTGASTRYLDKSDFVRLRNLTIGYTLPKTTLKDAGISSVRFYATGVNLLTFTNYTGYDPEARRDDAGIGEEFYSAPPARTIALGVNINF
ncbi:SusC/RagA family TonB-linked outer membrane protein [Flavobacterium sp. CF136]|uniref:SusC/RagA family TonB-linked outer membrane protein n=1 Tax=Flavobacterium sp. (strain CF136) TaxID=1144313 RepID=UPI0002717C73|nr:TonB-dependent receptor [Flavobacterium sp. CF136]EJL63915.1 TonB-linked outer membrane protein, SusC/RagA family [Flavobacterium sp. CF136]